jgi:4'-phosphopantetheinyl transferase
MPQVDFNFADNSKEVAIWKISENFNELEELCRDKFFVPQEINKWTINRKLQWMSSRLLLKILSPHSEIFFSQEKGPVQTQNNLFVSISHTNYFSCATISQTSPVGIDIEEINDKAKRISKKFLHASELQIQKNFPLEESSFCTLIWTIKESIFKKFHNLHLIFSEQIVLKSLKQNDNFFTAEVIVKSENKINNVVARIYKIENHYLCIV